MSTFKFRALAGLAGVAIGVAAAAAGPVTPAAEAPHFAPGRQWTLGGEGGWDYLAFDAAHHRLFVTRGTRVDVVDVATGTLAGSIPNTVGVHGVAFAEDLQRGFTSNGRANSVTVFDLNTLAVIREVAIDGRNPDAILYEPVGRHLFTFNGASKNVSVIDASTFEAVATLPMPGRPEFAVDDGAGHLFVNIETEPGRLVMIDSRKPAVLATWTLDGCANPTGLAIDRKHARLFSVCEDRVMLVTDARSGHAVARVAIGEHPDAAIYDADTGLVFSSNGEGSLTVVHQDGADHYAVVDTVPTLQGAKTMAYDPAVRRVFVAGAKFAPAPEPSAAQPHPRPQALAGSFAILTVEPR